MNGLVTDHAKKIRKLLDAFAEFDGVVRGVVDMEKVVELQHQRSGRQHRVSVLESRCAEVVADRTRIETEIRGYRKALSLFGDSVPDNTSGSSVTRLQVRIDSRINESEARALEIDEIKSDITGARKALESVEQRLVDELESCVAYASSRQGANAVVARRRAIASGDTMTEEIESMWSPTPVMAYRVWDFKDSGFYGFRKRWHESVFTATCISSGDVPHTDGRCSSVAFGCGVYASKVVDQLLRSTRLTANQNFAAGLVALEGKVVEHERGYRAERARVISLVIVHDGVMTIVDGEAEVYEAFLNPWRGGDETVLLPDIPTDKCMWRMIKAELKKREKEQNVWT